MLITVIRCRYFWIFIKNEYVHITILILNCYIYKISIFSSLSRISCLNSFEFIIKFADLFFEESAITLKKRLEDEYNLKDINIKKMSKNLYRVYKGPFYNLGSIKNVYNEIADINFENIELIKL